jgi:hypothetical protein
LARLAVVAIFLCSGFLLGARCIEGTSVYVDDGGYTHIVGTFVNESDISASTVTLNAKLFDAQGHVYAEVNDLMCPISVQPQSENVFDLRFLSPNLPAPARYEVRPISGKTLATQLPDPRVQLVDTAAYRVDGTLAVAGSATNSGTSSYNDLRYCSAAYDGRGTVLKIQTSPVQGPLAPGQTLRLPIVWSELPDSAAYLRVWLVVGESFQWVSTDLLPILNENP